MKSRASVLKRLLILGAAFPAASIVPAPSTSANATVGAAGFEEESEPELTGYSDLALKVMLDEASRARQVQSTRIGNMQSRAGFLLGASGLAASLTASAAGTVQGILALTAFAIAVLFALMMITTGRQNLSSPRELLNAGRGLDQHQMSYEVIDAIAIEWDEAEARLKQQEARAQWGVFAFTAGIVFLILHVTSPIEMPQPSEEPIRVIIEQENTPHG